MSAPLITINATVPEIEDLLMAGKSVQDVARDLQEPPNNVYGVYRALVERGEIDDPAVVVPRRPDLTIASQTTGPSGSASRPVPAPPAPAPPAAGAAEPTIDALVTAAVRSTSKRTQALGAKLGELAGVVRQRLRDERDAAEKAEAEKTARDAAAAEVARLEAQLAQAKAKLGRRPASDRKKVPGRARAGEVTAARYSGKKPCEKCGKDVTTLPGPRGAHMKRCAGGA